MKNTQESPDSFERINYSVRDFARAFGISPATLYKLWSIGEGPAYFTIGKRRLIPASERNWRPGCRQEQAA